MLAGDALAVGAAFECPVVKHREMAVARRMDIQFDDIGAGLEGCAHRRQGVLDKIMHRRVDHCRRARIRGQAFTVKGLVHAAMCQQNRPAAHSSREPTGVEKVERCDTEEENEKNNTKTHAAFPTKRASLRLGSRRKEGRGQGLTPCILASPIRSHPL
jgi:hypothetical protein